jgi:succinate dehydrogenase / fumarate reductase iron-sulfur subunit
MLPRSYGGYSWFAKFSPAAGKELLASLPVAIRAFMRRKMTVKLVLFGHKIPKQDLDAVKKIYEKIESREERYELNLYITGYDEPDETPVPAMATASNGGESPAAPETEGSAN